MYLSPIPTCLSHSRLTRTTTRMPQIPYSLRDRNAATMNPLTSASEVSPISKAALTSVPRAASPRRSPAGAEVVLALIVARDGASHTGPHALLGRRGRTRGGRRRGRRAAARARPRGHDARRAQPVRGPRLGLAHRG